MLEAPDRELPMVCVACQPFDPASEPKGCEGRALADPSG